jgi:hypothetical protein
MKSVRHFATWRILASSVAACGLAVGLAASAPAAHAGTGCNWAPITLASGWQSMQGAYGTGDPSYCVEDDGMVYLSGSVGANSGSAGATIGYLPAGAAPTAELYLDVYTMNGQYGVLRIDTSGSIEAYGGQGGSTQYTSLAGVSYPGASMLTWGIPLENGWQSAQSQWNTGDPGYSITNDVVHLSGSLRRPAGTPSGPTEAAADLSEQSLWPADNCFTPNTYTFGGSINTINVINGSTPEAFFYPAGTLFAANAQYTSLAGISYPAGGLGAVSWQGIPLLNGAKPSAGYYCPGAAFVTIGDVVYLSGQLTFPSGFSGEFAVLPPNARPTHYLYMIASNDVPIMITPDGQVAVTRPLGTSPAPVGLSGLSFALGS